MPIVSAAMLVSILGMRSGTGLAAAPELRSMGDYPHATATASGSDHAPITATFAT